MRRARLLPFLLACLVAEVNRGTLLLSILPHRAPISYVVPTPFTVSLHIPAYSCTYSTHMRVHTYTCAGAAPTREGRKENAGRRVFSNALPPRRAGRDGINATVPLAL